MPEFAQVPGDDRVVILRRPSGVVEMGQQRVQRRRGHGRAHVGKVLHARIDDLPRGDVGDARPGAVAPKDHRARGGDGPLCRGRALGAVFQRRAELALGGTEVGAGHGADRAGPRRRQKRPQAQRLPHGGAGTVQPQIRHAQVPRGIGGAGALVLQVAGDDVAQRVRRQRRLAQHRIEALLEHDRLRRLPAFLAEITVLADGVEAVPQRPLALQTSAHRGPGGGVDRDVDLQRLSPHVCNQDRSSIRFFDSFSEMGKKIRGTKLCRVWEESVDTVYSITESSVPPGSVPASAPPSSTAPPPSSG